MGTYITARVGSFFAGSLAAYNPGYVYADRWLTTGQHFYWHAALMGPMGMDRSLTNAGAANDNAPVLSVNEFYINPWQFAVGYALTQYPRWKTVLRHMTANTWWANVSRSANTLTFGVTRRTDAFTLNGLTAHTWLGINTISGFFNGSPLASNILPPTELAHQKMLSILSGSTNPVTGYLPQANGNNLTTYTRVVDLQNQPTKPSPKSYMTELANDALWKAIIFAGPRWSQTFREFLCHYLARTNGADDRVFIEFCVDRERCEWSRGFSAWFSRGECATSPTIFSAFTIKQTRRFKVRYPRRNPIIIGTRIFWPSCPVRKSWPTTAVLMQPPPPRKRLDWPIWVVFEAGTCPTSSGLNHLLTRKRFIVAYFDTHGARRPVTARPATQRRGYTMARTNSSLKTSPGNNGVKCSIQWLH
jgi:hypothetical protein